MIAVDEADVPRAHPNGMPDETITALRRLKLPEMPTAVDIRLEPTLVILDLYLAQSRKDSAVFLRRQRMGEHRRDRPLCSSWVARAG